jgi:hypothetical protein
MVDREESRMKMAAKMLVAVVGLAAVVGTGCQKYSTYPAVQTAKGMAEDPNSPTNEAVIVAALQYVATRYPPNGTIYAKAPNATDKLQADYPFAINLPAGMRKSFYERIPTKVGPLVQPVTQELVAKNELPVYHVTRVWLRFNSSTVDVLRPMPELGAGPDGKPVYQNVTVRLEGGFEPWRVLHARAWDPGSDDAPDYYFVPNMERVEQFKYSTAMTPAEQESYDRGLLSTPQPLVISPKVASEKESN